MKNFFKILTCFLIYFLCLKNLMVIANENIVADLSENNIEISTTFSGAKILLFGAYDGKKDDDIIVIVSGPKGQVKVEKKSKKYGIWMISDSIVFNNVPKYYYIASNRKIINITNKKEIIKKGFDLNTLKLGNTEKKISLPEREIWRKALTRNMISQKFWKLDESSILLNKNTLFRKTLSLPSNVSTGLFNVIIMHYRKGLLISREESSIKISKSGISASIYNIAQEYSALYGIIAVVLAVFIGWFANMIFRRI